MISENRAGGSVYVRVWGHVVEDGFKYDIGRHCYFVVELVIELCLLIYVEFLYSVQVTWWYTVLVLARQHAGSQGTCNPEETGLTRLPLSWSPNLFSGSGPVRVPPVPWTKKIEWSPFFIRHGGHYCSGHLVGRKIFWIFLVAYRK
jgi:hypothetical protein